MNSLVIAQTYWKQTNSKDSMYFLIIIGAIILFAIIYSIIKNGLKSGSSNSPSSIGSPKRVKTSVRRTNFKREAEAAGISSAEAEFLEYYANKIGTSSQAIFGNRAQLDNFMRNTYKFIEHNAGTEENAEDQKKKLFLIREAMGSRNSASKISSTANLKPGLPLSLVTSKNSHYSSILIHNDKTLLIEPALDAFGQALRFPFFSKLRVYFYIGNHTGYSFETRVKGLINDNGKKLLSINHSDYINPLPSRKSQRSEVRISARFYRAKITGGVNAKTIQVERSPTPGIIIDISGGGLSIQTLNPVQVSSLIKIEFNLGNGLRTALAKVVRVSRTRKGTLMHTKFVKISIKTVNEIRAVVYGYD